MDDSRRKLLSPIQPVFAATTVEFSNKSKLENFRPAFATVYLPRHFGESNYAALPSHLAEDG